MIPLDTGAVLDVNSSEKSSEEEEDDGVSDEGVDDSSGDKVVDNSSGNKVVDDSSGDTVVDNSSGDEVVEKGSGDGVGDGDKELKAGMQRGAVPEFKSHRLFGGQQTLGKSRHGRRLTWPPQGCQGSHQLYTVLLSPEESLSTDLIARCLTPTEGAAPAIYAQRPLNGIATFTAATCPRPWAAMSRVANFPK